MAVRPSATLPRRSSGISVLNDIPVARMMVE
jgi:hypothetical protein